MKRFISLILVLAMVIPAAGALAGGNHCGIEAQVLAGDQDIRIRLDIYAENDQIYITSTLVPDTCVRISGINAAEIGDAAAELIRNIRGGRMTEIAEGCLRDWIAFMQPETREGVFSGDAFDRATSMQRITFSWGDLTMLGRNTLKALKAEGLSGELLEGDWAELMTPQRNIRFDLKIFDGGKYASLGVLDGADTVMTVSANLADPDCALIITGCGTGGKNYYSSILAEKKENRVDITEMLYADDMKTGFPTLGSDSLICTQANNIEWTGTDGAAESCRLSGTLFPANGMKAIQYEGTVSHVNTGRVFEGTVSFSGYDGISATITADLDDETIGEMPARMIDLDRADEKELIGLGTEIGVALLPMLFQVINALPEEYITPVMQLMN